MSNLEHITLEMDKVPLGDNKTLENISKHSYGGAIDGRTRNTLRVPRADGNDNPGVDDGLFSTVGGNGGNGGNVNVNVPNGGRRPSFSFPGYNGPGFVTINGVETPIPDVNAYQHKKTLAQGMMDLALLSANANQLRYVLETSSQHPYFYPSLLFISLSIIFQIAVGVGLILNGQYNIKNGHDICRANRINNYTVSGIFIVTVVNVLISAFTVDRDTVPALPANTT
uniref:Isoform D of Ninjurin-A n=1 Tax=Drosophila melanogaster TaxID=7227 RepID=Q8MPP0-2|nr:ninjurin A, isoform D [Drosophila melanogaster]AGB94381.1 ninjurin A, isoform D [Drosophila melanogaster]|eukprot:NP_001261687.1 ninjurin A, isoform D [Drosophila melanogaster]